MELLPAALRCWGSRWPPPRWLLDAPSWAFVPQRPQSCHSRLLPGAELREQSPATRAPKHNTRNYGLSREEEEGWLTSGLLAAAGGRKEHGVPAAFRLLRGSFRSWRENLLPEEKPHRHGSGIKD